MHVDLAGSSPATATAGIMLLTRARQIGYRVSVNIVGDASDITAVEGPALCYAPVLASCGVGRAMGSGATVIVPGPLTTPLIATVHPHGESGWFEVERTGHGAHAAAKEYVALSQDPRPRAREVGRRIRHAMKHLGLSRDAAVLDTLFGADVAPLTRIAVGLRAGRALSGQPSQPVTRFLMGDVERDPLPHVCGPEQQAFALTGDLQWILDGLSPTIRDEIETAFDDLRALSTDGEYTYLIYHLLELVSQLIQLPSRSILPPLGAAEDSVATGLKSAMIAEGTGDANRALSDTFTFLGGRYIEHSDHAVSVGAPPDTTSRVALWEWFCKEVRIGRNCADSLWPDLIDPPS